MSVLAKLYDSAFSGRDDWRSMVTADSAWNLSHPFNALSGADAIERDWLVPLQAAMGDVERRPLIEFNGDSDGRPWSAGTGYFLGSFNAPFLGIAPTGKSLYLRYSELVRYEDDRVAEMYLWVDVLDAMHQAGVYPLREPLGHSGLILGPAGSDGLNPPDLGAEHAAQSVQLIMEMLDGLRQYDGVSLESMPLADFWDSDFMWFGPGGIGTTRGIDGFRAHHQGPFLQGFPDRDVDHHACTLACGDYVATGGWPHMHGTHSGDGWLGLPASGVHLELRVMDIWRREGAMLKENWVAIDIPHMLLQMGIDIFNQESEAKRA